LLEDALLAKNKILIQLIEQLTTQMAKCEFCGGDHPNSHYFYQNNSLEVEDPFVLER